MNTRMKRLICIPGALLAGLLLAAVIIEHAFDINSYKPRIETALSDATGMEAHINGPMKLALFPRAGASVEKISLQRKGRDVATLRKAEVAVRLLPLLRKEVLIQWVGLTGPEIFITKDRKGRFNFEGPGEKAAAGESPLPVFEVGKISVKDGHLLYQDEKSGEKVEANGCDLTIKDLSASGKRLMDTLSLSGTVSCREVKAKGFRVTDTKVALKAGGGTIQASPLKMKISGGEVKGALKGNMLNKSPEYSADLSIAGFRMEEAPGQAKNIRGAMDLKAHLTAQGRNSDELSKTARGEVSLRGQDLVLLNIDIDRVLEKYEKSQSINIVDVGAFVLAGPLSTVVTKGYDLGGLYKASVGGETTIQRLVSDWKIAKGIARAEDVAFTTKKNRMALKGSLDLAHERFEDVTVAVLNAKGCAVFSQKITGAFRDPRMDKPGMLKSLLNPFISLAEKPIDLLSGGSCEVFYKGSLPHPAK